MANEPAVEAVEEGAKAQPEQPVAPKEEPPRARKPDRNIAELQRVKDREVADANRKAKEALGLVEQHQAEITQLREMLKHSGLTDNEETRLKALIQREKAAQDREANAYKIERAMTVKLLTSQYGIPADDLEAYDDPRDMELAALKWERAHPSKQEADEDDEPPATRQQPPERSRFDLGTGSGTSKSFKDMTKAEVAAWESQEKAKAIARMRSR